MNPVYNLTPYSSKTHSNIILLSRLGILRVGFSTRHFERTSHPNYACYTPRPFHLSCYQKVSEVHRYVFVTVNSTLLVQKYIYLIVNFS